MLIMIYEFMGMMILVEKPDLKLSFLIHSPIPRVGIHQHDVEQGIRGMIL
jgi:hypothetical protein